MRLVFITYMFETLSIFHNPQITLIIRQLTIRQRDTRDMSSKTETQNTEKDCMILIGILANQTRTLQSKIFPQPKGNYHNCKNFEFSIFLDRYWIKMVWRARVRSSSSSSSSSSSGSSSGSSSSSSSTTTTRSRSSPPRVERQVQVHPRRPIRPRSRSPARRRELRERRRQEIRQRRSPSPVRLSRRNSPLRSSTPRQCRRNSPNRRSPPRRTRSRSPHRHRRRNSPNRRSLARRIRSRSPPRQRRQNSPSRRSRRNSPTRRSPPGRRSRSPLGWTDRAGRVHSSTRANLNSGDRSLARPLGHPQTGDYRISFQQLQTVKKVLKNTQNRLRNMLVKSEGFIATIVNMTRFFYAQDFGGFTRTLSEHFLTRINRELADQVRNEILEPFLDRFPEATLQHTGPFRVVNPDGATMAINGQTGPISETETDSSDTIIEIEDEVEPGQPGYFGTTVAEMIRHEEFAYLGGAPRAPVVEQGTIEASEPVIVNHSAYIRLKRAHFCTHLFEKFLTITKGHWSHLTKSILLLVTTVILNQNLRQMKNPRQLWKKRNRSRHRRVRSKMSNLNLLFIYFFFKNLGIFF